MKLDDENFIKFSIEPLLEVDETTTVIKESNSTFRIQVKKGYNTGTVYISDLNDLLYKSRAALLSLRERYKQEVKNP